MLFRAYAVKGMPDTSMHNSVVSMSFSLTLGVVEEHYLDPLINRLVREGRWSGGRGRR